jgi:hypothetical protein
MRHGATCRTSDGVDIKLRVYANEVLVQINKALLKYKEISGTTPNGGNTATDDFKCPCSFALTKDNLLLNLCLRLSNIYRDYLYQQQFHSHSV